MRSRASSGVGRPPTISIDNLLDPSVFVQLGVAPVRVDLLPKLFTTTFKAAWERRVTARFGSVKAYYLSRADLIAEKRFSARAQDLADLEQLERPARGRPSSTKAAGPRKHRRPQK